MIETSRALVVMPSKADRKSGASKLSMVPAMVKVTLAT